MDTASNGNYANNKLQENNKPDFISTQKQHGNNFHNSIDMNYFNRNNNLKRNVFTSQSMRKSFREASVPNIKYSSHINSNNNNNNFRNEETLPTNVNKLKNSFYSSVRSKNPFSNNNNINNNDSNILNIELKIIAYLSSFIETNYSTNKASFIPFIGLFTFKINETGTNNNDNSNKDNFEPFFKPTLSETCNFPNIVERNPTVYNVTKHNDIPIAIQKLNLISLQNYINYAFNVEEVLQFLKRISTQALYDNIITSIPNVGYLTNFNNEKLEFVFSENALKLVEGVNLFKIKEGFKFHNKGVVSNFSNYMNSNNTLTNSQEVFGKKNSSYYKNNNMSFYNNNDMSNKLNKSFNFNNSSVNNNKTNTNTYTNVLKKIEDEDFNVNDNNKDIINSNNNYQILSSRRSQSQFNTLKQSNSNNLKPINARNVNNLNTNLNNNFNNNIFSTDDNNNEKVYSSIKNKDLQESEIKDIYESLLFGKEVIFQSLYSFSGKIKLSELIETITKTEILNFNQAVVFVRDIIFKDNLNSKSISKLKPSNSTIKFLTKSSNFQNSSVNRSFTSDYNVSNNNNNNYRISDNTSSDDKAILNSEVEILQFISMVNYSLQKYLNKYSNISKNKAIEIIENKSQEINNNNNNSNINTSNNNSTYYYSTLINNQYRNLETIILSQNNITKIAETLLNSNKKLTETDLSNIIRDSGILISNTDIKEIYEILLYKNNNSSFSLRDIFRILTDMKLLFTDYKTDEIISFIDSIERNQCLYDLYNYHLSKDIKSNDNSSLSKEDFINKLRLVLKKKNLFNDYSNLKLSPLLENYFYHVNSKVEGQNTNDTIVNKMKKLTMKNNEKFITISQIKNKINNNSYDNEEKTGNSNNNYNNITNKTNIEDTYENSLSINKEISLIQRLRTKMTIQAFQNYLRENKLDINSVLILLKVFSNDEKEFDENNFILRMKLLNKTFSNSFLSQLFKEIFELQKEISSGNSNNNTNRLESNFSYSSTIQNKSLIDSINKNQVKINEKNSAKDNKIQIDDIFLLIINVFKQEQAQTKIDRNFSIRIKQIISSNTSREALVEKFHFYDKTSVGVVSLKIAQSILLPYIDNEFKEGDLKYFIISQSVMDFNNDIDYSKLLNHIFFDDKITEKNYNKTEKEDSASIISMITKNLSLYMIKINQENNNREKSSEKNLFLSIIERVFSKNTTILNLINEEKLKLKLTIDEFYYFIRNYIYLKDFNKNILFKFDLDKDGKVSYEDLRNQLKKFDECDSFKYNFSGINSNSNDTSNNNNVSNAFNNFNTLTNPEDSYFKSFINSSTSINLNSYKTIIAQIKQALIRKKLSMDGFLKLLDPSNSGIITAEEFYKGINQVYPLSNTIKEAFFNELDSYKLGMIDYNSFKTAFKDLESLYFNSNNKVGLEKELRIIKGMIDVTKQKHLDEEGLFIMLDSDVDGVVNKSDLMKFAKDLFKFDLDKDDDVSYKKELALSAVGYENIERVIHFIRKGSLNNISYVDNTTESVYFDNNKNKDLNGSANNKGILGIDSYNGNYYFTKHDLILFFQRKASLFKDYYHWITENKGSNKIENNNNTKIQTPYNKQNTIKTHQQSNNTSNNTTKKSHSLSDSQKALLENKYSSFNIISDNNKSNISILFLLETLIEKIGLFISEKYSSIEECFKYIKTHFNSTKSNYLNYQEFLFLVKDLSQISVNMRLTQDEVLAIFTVLDPHKKSYITLDDLQLKLKKYDFYYSIHDYLTTFLRKNFNSAEEGFEFILGSRANKAFDLYNNNEYGSNTNKNSIFESIISEKNFIEEIEKLLMNSYNKESISKYFRRLISSKNNVSRGLTFNQFKKVYYNNVGNTIPSLSNINTSKNNGYSDKSNFCKSILFNENKQTINEENRNSLINPFGTIHENPEEYDIKNITQYNQNTNNSPYDLKHNFNTINNITTNTSKIPNNKNNSSLKDNNDKTSNSKNSISNNTNPLETLKTLLKLSRFDYSNYFNMYLILNNGLLEEYQFKNMLRNFNIGLSSNEITEIAKRASKNNERKFILKDFIQFLNFEDETSKKINQNTYMFVSELKNMIVMFHGNPRIAINTYLKQKLSEDNKLSLNRSINTNSVNINSSMSNVKNNLITSLNFNDFNIIVKNLFEKAKQQPPNFSIVQNMFRFIDLKKDGFIDSFEWNKVFSQVEIKGEVSSNSNSNSTNNIFDTNTINNSKNKNNTGKTLSHLRASSKDAKSTGSIYNDLSQKSTNYSNNSGFSNIETFKSKLKRQSSISKVLREWETSDDYNIILDLIYKNRNQIRSACNSLLLKEDSRSSSLIPLFNKSTNHGSESICKRIILMEDLILVFETLFSTMKLSKTQWRILCGAAQICKTGKVDLEMLFSLAKDQKKN